MKRYTAVLLSLTLAACAAPQEAPPAATDVAQAGAANAQLLCETTYVTGSALPKKRCETAEERERQRKLASETASTLSRSVGIPKKEGGLN